MYDYSYPFRSDLTEDGWAGIYTTLVERTSVLICLFFSPQQRAEHGFLDVFKARDTLT